MKFEIKCGKCRKPLKLSGSRDIHTSVQDIFVEPCDCCEKGNSDNAVINILKANNANLQEKFTSMQTAKDMFEKKFNSTRAQLIKIMDNIQE